MLKVLLSIRIKRWKCLSKLLQLQTIDQHIKSKSISDLPVALPAK